ncbi:hypothetical protein GCM10027073_68750 [Streptomyces chlorus]
MAKRVVGGPTDGGPRPQPLDAQDPLEFVVKGPQGIGTIGATVEDSRVTEGIVSNSREENGGTTPEAALLTDAQLTALAAVPRDKKPRTAGPEPAWEQLPAREHLPVDGAATPVLDVVLPVCGYSMRTSPGAGAINRARRRRRTGPCWCARCAAPAVPAGRARPPPSRTLRPLATPPRPAVPGSRPSPPDPTAPG